MVNLFLFEASEVREGEVEVRDPVKVEHLRKVLKAVEGTTVRMGLIGGGLFEGTVLETAKTHYRFRLQAVPEAAASRSDAVCLLLGTPRPNMIKSICTVSATMGVDRLVFVRSERVDKSYFQSKMLGDEAVRKNLIHGAEQGVIRCLPRVATYPNPSLETFLTDVFPGLVEQYQAENPDAVIVKLIAHPHVEDNLIAALTKASNFAPSTYVILAIGPEGGWIPPEVDLLQAHGFAPFHCGERILRTETAVIALLSQVMLARDAVINDQLKPSAKRAKSDDNANDNNNNNE